MRDDTGVLASSTQAFLRWYFPRFMAKTFALARQDEYEADRIASKLVGRDVAGAALTEVAIKGAWLSTKFWPLHWRTAVNKPQPSAPFAAMRMLLAQPMEDDFSRDALRQSLKQLSDVDDTHPVLRDRLEALQVGTQPPTWSTRAAIELLGPSATKWLAHFDKEWCRENATDWKLHHAYLARVQARIDTLQASIERNSADEMTQLGDLQRRLAAKADVRSCYERALQITPAHGGALRGLASCLPETEFATRMDCATQLYEDSAANKWWACQTPVRMLEQTRSKRLAGAEVA